MNYPAKIGIKFHLLKWLLALNTCLTPCFSQIVFNFEDTQISEWEQSPSEQWAASNINPLSGNYSLKHIFDSDESGFTAISNRHPLLNLTNDSCTWEFGIRHGYNPSSSNNWAVFVAANGNAAQMNPTSDISAIIVGVNYSDSDDTLRLYYQHNNTIDVVITSSLDWQENIGPDSVVYLRITSSQGRWQIGLINDKGFTNIGEGYSDELSTSQYSGVYYKFSKTYDQLLWFDDFMINGNFYNDTEAPVLENAFFVNRHTILLTFNEGIHARSLKTKNFTIDGKYSADSVRMENDRKLLLFYNHEFEMESQVILTYYVEDLYENAITADTGLFYYFVHPNDVVITEIMADPDPPKLLPNTEYLELYNTTPYTLLLNSYTLCINDKCIGLPDFQLLPDTYILIVHENYCEAFSDTINILAVNSLPSLLNDGALVSLKDDYKQVIHAVGYSKNWYHNEIKSIGGWSLEIIDTDNACGGETNWTASYNKNGGTPGFANSNQLKNPDVQPPFIINSQYMNDSTIFICFNETMDTTQLEFTVNSENISIHDIHSTSPLHRCFRLVFSSSMLANTEYVLQVSNTACDCAGHAKNPSPTTAFAKPEYPDSNEVIINELYFNPFPEEDDYIEILNNSNHYLLLSDLYLANPTTDSSGFENFMQFSPEPIYFAPTTLLAISPDTLTLKNYHSITGKLHLIHDLPSMPDNEGNIVVLNDQMTIIDKVNYSSSWHCNWIDDDEGISLERLNPNWPSQSSSNWYSASYSSDYATPGLTNSQFTEQENQNDLFYIPNELFMPYDDNESSLLKIHYRGEAQKLVNIHIFNTNGQLVKNLCKSEILGSDGIITWNGSNNQGYKCPIGIYIVYIETIDDNGKIEAQKLSCVLGKQF